MLPFNETEFQKVIDATTVKEGDIVWIKFKINPGWLYVKAAGIAAIEDRLEKEKSFEIITRYYQDEGFVWYKIKIIDPKTIKEKAGTQNAGLALILAEVIALFVVIGTSVYFSLSKTSDMYKYKGLASGIITPQDVIAIENAKSSDSTGSQVQKAGIGIAIPIIAAIVLVYFWSRSK